MPYIEVQDYAWPKPITYDVLVRTGGDEPSEQLLVNQPAVEEGGMIGAAQAAADAAGATLLDAWVHGGRIWSDVTPDPVNINMDEDEDAR